MFSLKDSLTGMAVFSTPVFYKQVVVPGNDISIIERCQPGWQKNVPDKVIINPIFSIFVMTDPEPVLYNPDFAR